MQVVGGADDGTGGERYVGTGDPIEVPSTEPSVCVVARSMNDSGQVSTDAGPVCSG